MLLGETAELRFVDKPVGLPVFPPHADSQGDCVLARLLVAFPDQSGAFPPGFEGGIAHRLDTLTGGFVVVAKTPAVLSRLRAEWTTLRKVYELRSSGAVAFRETVVTAPIANHARRADRVVVQRWPQERHRGKWLTAETWLSRLGDGLWQAEIHTGVRHQVRAHAAFAGLPLDGDELYGGGPGMPHLRHVGIHRAGWSFCR